MSKLNLWYVRAILLPGLVEFTILLCFLKLAHAFSGLIIVNHGNYVLQWPTSQKIYWFLTCLVLVVAHTMYAARTRLGRPGTIAIIFAIIILLAFTLQSLQIFTAQTFGATVPLEVLLKNIIHPHLFIQEFMKKFSRAQLQICILHLLTAVLFLILHSTISGTLRKAAHNTRGKAIVVTGILLVLFVIYYPDIFANRAGGISSGAAAQPNLKSRKLNAVQAQKPSVIFLFLFESTRNDTFEALLPETPTLAATLRPGPALFSPVPHTSAALFSIITGRYAEAGRSPDFIKVPPRETLAGLLQALDYKLYYLSSGVTNYESVADMLRHFNFNVADKESLLREAKQDGRNFAEFNWGADDRILLLKYQKVQQECYPPQKCFILVHFSNAHSPYFDATHPQSIYAADINAAQHRYSNAIRTGIEVTWRILSNARAEGVIPAVFVTSDHGQSFGENGYGKHGFSLNIEEISIPFYFDWPGGIFFQAKHGTLLDFYATINDLLQAEPGVRSHGESLMRPKTNPVFLRSWVHGATGLLSNGSIRICDRNRKAGFTRAVRGFSYEVNTHDTRCD